jgi:hypothetical protein
MPIISRREIETLLVDYLQLSREPAKESRARQSHRHVNEVLMPLTALGPMQDRGTVPAIAGQSLLPKNATRACAVNQWFCGTGSWH